MFYNSQTTMDRNKYQQFLTLVGSLSNLFSDSDVPYLYYRIAEKIFCRAFNAEDLSRSDVSADAKKDSIGIGLKTFLAGNYKSFQKVAEFNADRKLYTDLISEELVKKVSQLRNYRIDFTKKLHSLNDLIYHCVLRDKNRFKIFEEHMHRIDIDNIANVNEKKNTIIFNDGRHEYSFSLSKSTLTKRFITNNLICEFEINILKDPLVELQNCINYQTTFQIQNKRIQETIFLPLYGNNKKVYEHSGLNQWNARGRDRHHDEVYIPVPIVIHKYFPHFFPSRDTSFNLIFPDGDSVVAKICQANGKALMTQSNRKLGKLILRDGLHLKVNELVTYEKLQLLGIDSVRIDKLDMQNFEINFSRNGSYEKFKVYNKIC